MFSHRNIWYAVWNVQHRVFFISSWHIGDSEHGFIPKLWPALVDRAKFWRRVLDDKTIHKLPSPFNNKADELAVLYRGLSINILILNICSYYCFQIYLKMQDNTEQTDYAEHFPTISESTSTTFFLLCHTIKSVLRFQEQFASSIFLQPNQRLSLRSILYCYSHCG